MTENANYLFLGTKMETILSFTKVKKKWMMPTFNITTFNVVMSFQAN